LNQEIRGHSQLDNKPKNINDRYHSLFDNVPISLWEEDFSTVKTYLDDLRGRGIEDIRHYFENNIY